MKLKDKAMKEHTHTKENKALDEGLECARNLSMACWCKTQLFGVYLPLLFIMPRGREAQMPPVAPAFLYLQ